MSALCDVNTWNGSNTHHRANYKRVRDVLRGACRRYGPLSEGQLLSLILENDDPSTSGLNATDLIGAVLFWQQGLDFGRFCFRHQDSAPWESSGVMLNAIKTTTVIGPTYQKTQAIESMK